MKRVCKTCGRPIEFGCMTEDGGGFYAHEGKCFTKYMNKRFGKHKWMALGNGEQDEYGGYYICSEDVVGGFQGTGIYYTEYTPDELTDDTDGDMYVNTEAPNDVVSGRDIYSRYVDINGDDMNGFVDYVRSGFRDNGGMAEYRKVTK